jgi:hypothetical protein
MILKSVRVQSVKNLRIVINILNKKCRYKDVKKDVTPKIQKSVRTYDDAQIEKLIRNGGL